MRVSIVTSVEPYVFGGARVIVDSLERQLCEHGHEVDVIRIPVSFSTHTYLDQCLAFRLLDMSEWGDRLIAIRTPSYLVEHPAKSVWFIHQWRYLFDLWDSEYGPQTKTAHLEGLRESVRRSDNASLKEARNLYANSQVVADRVRLYNGLQPTVLYPPIESPERFSCGEYGDYLLCVSRVTPLKRQRLMVQAMAYVKSDVRLVLAGTVDNVQEGRAIHALIDQLGMNDRVTFANTWIDEAQKEELYRGCLANVYLPGDEDSYGYSTLEAAHASKATITTNDSGGVLEFVQDGDSGFVVEPDPEELAIVFDRVFRDRHLAASVGASASRRIDELGITWERVVGALLR
jgi:glycosyltransferase involved in cell wall biosynthesis